ncbi:MAG TPA: hypothetical protein VI956_04440 [Nitrospirota bacterium]|jgi:hypothetical protein|nr:hypothetical protein [Nitrospirota bacterium]
MIRLDLFTMISGLAIVTMFIALWQAIDYKSSVPGGVVGKTWNLITTLVAFFFIGYLTTPFFVLLTQEFKDLIVAFIFFFGAIYVLITIRLVHKIIMVMKGE